jgi:diguanylate cyclase (GGDEF)-like protein
LRGGRHYESAKKNGVMNPNGLFRIRTSDNPERLLHLLVTTAIVSIAIIIAIGGFSFYRVFSGFVMRNAETNSIHLCEMLVGHHRDVLFTLEAGNRTVLQADATELQHFDHDLRRDFASYHVLKVKIYNRDKKIVYSTDPELIGKVDAGNLRLTRALAGAVDAKMETKEDAHDLKEERLFDVDVVETYVPILGADGHVVGSFEIYLNVTPYRDQIRKGVAIAILFLTAVILTVFAVSFLLIRSGTAQLKDAQAQLEALACTDTLTGIANRRCFFRWGEEVFAKVLRERSAGGPGAATLCCLLIDVDYFKTINDTWGHLAGDRVLQGVAERLESSVRPYDITGRYGGEEFAVLLPDTTFEVGLAVAERVRARMREEHFKVAEEEVLLTVSIGLACTTAPDASLTDLLRRADEGLYRAKDKGRDQIVWV